MNWEIGFDGDSEEVLLIIPLKTFDEKEGELKAKKLMELINKKEKENATRTA